MARSYRPVDRDQVYLLPPDMAEWLPDDHLVWFVIDVIDQLDTAAFHQPARVGGVGRQGYNPDMMLGLLIYAYAVGERSSRRIERLCRDHVAFRVMCAQDAPDHSAISTFRKVHQDAFTEIFAQVLRLCAAAGMVKVGVVSIDGTKIAANASKGANRSPEWIRHKAAEAAREVVEDAAAVDAADDHAAAKADDTAGDDLPPSLKTRTGRARNLRKALDELDRQDADHAKADQVDRDRVADFIARAETEPVRGGTPAGVDPVEFERAKVRRFARLLAEYEGHTGATAAQARGAAQRQLRRAEERLAKAEAAAAAGEVDLRGRSQRRREQRAARARDRGATGDAINVTDPDSRLMTEGSGGGSVQGYNAQIAVTDDHLILGIHLSQDANDTGCYLPTLHAATLTATLLDTHIDRVLADAGYFTDTNLTAPGPDRLIAPGKHRDLTTNTGRTQPDDAPPKDASPQEVMRHRIRQPGNAAAYKRRSATVEPVIGHLKDTTRLRRFARRGLAAAKSELELAATAINIARLHTTTS